MNTEPIRYEYPRWLYEPFIKAVLAKAGVKRGASVLDVGCGWGQFSAMIADCGMVVDGIDSCADAVKEAADTYADLDDACRFWVCDALGYTGPKVDVVFCRALSLYNKNPYGNDFYAMHNTTVKLLGYLKPGGCIVWLHPSRLAPELSPGWRWHTLADTKYRIFPYNARVYFSSRLETVLFGHWALNPFFTWLAAMEVKLSGRRIGGELLAIIRKP